MIAYLSSATRCPVERFRAALYGDETRRRSENKGRNRKSGKRKGRNALDILHFARGPRCYVSILKGNTGEMYIRYLLFFTPYLEGSCLLSSAKGASLRCRGEPRIPGEM